MTPDDCNRQEDEMSDAQKAREMAARLRGPIMQAGQDLIDRYFRRSDKTLATIPADLGRDADLVLTIGVKEAADLLDALATRLEPGEDVAGLVERLREHCVGHPAAKVPWPHSVLHDAMRALTTLSARVREAEARSRRRGEALARLKAEVGHAPWLPAGVIGAIVDAALDGEAA